MANDYFQFKQFLVRQDKSAFKVGTDSVMLGAWADISGVSSVLDIGTGSGLLALMLAQRCLAKITGIEIDADSYEQALSRGSDFKVALEDMKKAAETGRDATKDMMAKLGRSSRLGERSRGVIDAGAASCALLLGVMADSIMELLEL